MDREVYEVDPAVQAADGTVADALNRVPGVVVDPRGSVTLHGRHVEIYINGHPSLLLAGDNRGAALKAMPSRYVSSIEVIATPGAQFGAQGAGGIINLVTNHALPDSHFGSVNIQATSTGTAGSTAFLMWHTGKLTFNGFIGGNRDVSDQHSRLTVDTFGPDALPLQTSRSAGAAHTVADSRNGAGNFEYELGPDDILRGQGSLMQVRSRSDNASRYTLSGAGGQPLSLYSDALSGEMSNDSSAVGLGWTHYGRKPDETLKIDGAFSTRRNDARFADRYTYDLPPDAPEEVRSTGNRTRGHSIDLTLDYNTPVGDDQLSIGLQVTREHEAARATSTLSGGMSGFDSDFIYSQTLSAAYIAWQREFGDKWTVLAGLRSETLDLDTRLVTTESTGHVRYTRLNPSLFATYVVSPAARWRLSYAHRLQRPAPRDLNPYVIYIDPSHVTAGNPDLRPQETDVYEANYEHTGPALTYTVRGFYNRDQYLITWSSVVVPGSAGDPALGPVIRTSPVNAGTATSGGIEVTLNRTVTQKLFLNTTFSLQAARQPGFDGAGAQSLTTASGSLGVTYMASMTDSLSFNINTTGKRLTGQGYMSPFTFDSLFYSHTLSPKLQLTVSVNNLLRMSKMTFVTDTPALRSTAFTSPQSPTVFISLNRSFGGVSEKEK